MAVRLENAVTEVLSRLDDSPDKMWTRSEVELYVRDGYDTLCDRARVLFDMAVVPNVSPVGSYGTDLQKDLALHTPGVRIEENRLNVTQDPEYQKGTDQPSGYAGSYDLPVKSGEGNT